MLCPMPRCEVIDVWRCAGHVYAKSVSKSRRQVGFISRKKRFLLALPFSWRGHAKKIMACWHDHAITNWRDGVITPRKIGALA